MPKRDWTTMRITIINKNWLELERMIHKHPTLDDALTSIRKKYRSDKKDLVFHL